MDGTSKRPKISHVRRLKTQNLKVPQISERIVDIVNILQHENFLDVVDRFFKPKSNKQPRTKKPQSKKANVSKDLDSKTKVLVSTESHNNAL